MDNDSARQPRDNDRETHSEPQEALNRDPDTAPNAPNRDPADAPDADQLVNQTDTSDGHRQTNELSDDDVPDRPGSADGVEDDDPTAVAVT